MRKAAAMLVPVLALVAGCDGAVRDQRKVAVDPVMAAALDEQLMTDPDLARMNPRSAALLVIGPPSAPLPADDTSAETIAAARAEASRLAGGALLPAPEPAAGAGWALDEELTAAAALTEAGSPRDCARNLDYAFIWAARMPAGLPIYPRGHVQDAAGSDAAGCRLRAITFRTPVPASDVVDFYWSRARAAGLGPSHRLQGEDHVIAGRKGEAGFVAHIRTHDLFTEVDLATSGL